MATDDGFDKYETYFRGDPVLNVEFIAKGQSSMSMTIKKRKAAANADQNWDVKVDENLSFGFSKKKMAEFKKDKRKSVKEIEDLVAFFSNEFRAQIREKIKKELGWTPADEDEYQLEQFG